MCEHTDPSPSEHVRELMSRVQNPFDIPDRMLAELDAAVVHQVELQAWRHRNSPPPTVRCSSHRHVFLLTDGSTRTLWELCYDRDNGSGQLSEIYADEDSLHRSARRVHPWPYGVPQTGGPDRTPWDEGPPFPRPPSPLGEGGRERRIHTGGRRYAEGNSAEHARRLLRRAENTDRPGEETLRLLSTALGHEIAHVPRPRPTTGQCQVWCSVYEHAFLLPGGREVSLYELEHNLSGTDRLVCEVYLEEDTADQVAHRYVRERGTGS